VLPWQGSPALDFTYGLPDFSPGRQQGGGP
jgi:hypothetical protein